MKVLNKEVISVLILYLLLLTFCVLSIPPETEHKDSIVNNYSKFTADFFELHIFRKFFTVRGAV